MMERTCPLSSNAGMVRLDIYEPQNDVWGRLHNIYRKDAIPCENLGDMVLKMDMLCEELAFPMALMESRTFGKGAKKGKCHSQPELCHPVNTFNFYKQPIENDTSIPSHDAYIVFFIQVLYRQNASIQGEVVWAGTTLKKQCFRSGMELMKLIQGVLAGEETDERTGTRRMSASVEEEAARRLYAGNQGIKEGDSA